MKKQTLVVINPQSRKRGEHLLKKLCSVLETRNLQYQVIYTQPDPEITYSSINSYLESAGQVIVLGGDGTIHMLANILAYKDIPLGIIPCGTGNDFCKNIYQSDHDIISAVLDSPSRPVDLGSCNGIYFINVLGVGYDGMVAKSTSGTKSGPFRSFVYLWNALKYLPLYKEVDINLVSNNLCRDEPAFLVAFANGVSFANGMKVAPLAEISDGKLDCCWVGKMSFTRKIYALLKIFSGKHINVNGIEYSQGEKFEVKTSGLPVEADGEYIGQSPVLVKIEKNALLLKVP